MLGSTLLPFSSVASIYDIISNVDTHPPFLSWALSYGYSVNRTALPQEVGAAPDHLTAMAVKESGAGTSRRMCSFFFILILMLTKTFVPLPQAQLCFKVNPFRTG